MKWGEQDTYKFVKLYKDNEVLWNPANPNYKDKTSRHTAMENIASEMGKNGFGVTEVRQKIKNIRSTYHQEVAKIKQSATTGKEYVPSVKWFPLLDSIMKFVASGTLDSTYLDGETTFEEIELRSEPHENYQEEMDLVVLPLEASLLQQNTSVPSSTKGRKRKTAVIKREENARSSEISSRPNLDDSDEVDIFCKYVSKTLKKLSDHDSICAQQEIQAVLTKYRLGYCQSSTVETSNDV
ncbi:uncharacterized protein LOC128993376 [Macrosteles quadrilineatus]|uniref:uncharacterized protein LOC128993376 n=1 Tax=Macrosteles quadrilineatus TaxID=74068 RepID=UPI0023E2EAF3|nr:uncharacterized protein LOC128993376 [Macrosteles quadrilineatus]